LLAAGLWGVSGFVGGLAARRAGALRVAAGTQLVGLLAVLLVLLAARPEWPGAEELVPALLGGLAGGIGLAAFFRALSVTEIGIAAPVAATGVAVPIVASLVLGQVPTAVQAAGIVFAVAGVVLATYDARGRDGDGAGAGTRGIAFAAIAALLFGLFYLGLDMSGDADVLWTVVAARTLSVAFLCSWLAAASRDAAPGSDRPPQAAAIAASGILDVSANAAFTFATTLGALALAAVPAALYPIVTLLCARVVLSERLRPMQQAGASSALLGVALMAVPG
jgi:drug/metabolite transporter (DMT)-like permease